MEVFFVTKKKQEKQNGQEESILSRSLMTGFFGGILWSIFGVIIYYFNFAEVAPKTFLLRSWSTAKWTNGWLGDVVSIVMVGILSILIAFIYYGLLKKVSSMWMGVVYGIILWGITFYILQPIFSTIPPLVDFNKDTIVSTICLFILYGTFIGYSISFNYHSMEIEEKKNTENSK